MLVMGYLGIHDDSRGPAQLMDFLLALGGLVAFVFDGRKRCNRVFSKGVTSKNPALGPAKE